MEWIVFLILVVAVVAVVAAGLWAKKYFRHEIERAKRIDRANKNQ
jgi:regulator of protease activity HflC (stomatin/prohibitin superfamily)